MVDSEGIEDETEPETEIEEDESRPKKSKLKAKTRSKKKVDTDDDLHDNILNDVQEQLDDGRLRYEETPGAVLKPINYPVLKPEDDPSVA